MHTLKPSVPRMKKDKNHCVSVSSRCHGEEMGVQTHSIQGAGSPLKRRQPSLQTCSAPCLAGPPARGASADLAFRPQACRNRGQRSHAGRLHVFCWGEAALRSGEGAGKGVSQVAPFTRTAEFSGRPAGRPALRAESRSPQWMLSRYISVPLDSEGQVT